MGVSEQTQNYDDSINVDHILSNDASHHSAEPFIVEKDVQFSSIPEIKPIISREGIRKANKSASVTSGTRRTKKSQEQVLFLTKLYKRLGGKWDGRVRKEAMQATGLSRIQIYKWFFDRQLQEQSKTKKSKSATESYDESSDVEDVEQTENFNNEKQPIFMVEKIPVRQWSIVSEANR